MLLGLRQGSHGAGEWCFPGGSVEFGETAVKAAKREAKEEAGLIVDELEIISVSDERRYIKTDNKHYVVIGFKAKHVEGEPKLMEPNKFKDWQWFSIDKLPEKVYEGSEDMIKNYNTGKIYQVI